MEIRARRDVPLVWFLHLGPPYIHQLLRFRIGQRLQIKNVDHAEDDRVGTDAQRKRRHCGGSKAAILEKCPPAVTQVLQNGLQSRQAALLVQFIPKPPDSPERQPRRAPRLLRGHPTTNILVGGKRKMSLQFLVRLLIFAAAGKPSAHSRQQNVQSISHHCPLSLQLQQPADNC